MIEFKVVAQLYEVMNIVACIRTRRMIKKDVILGKAWLADKTKNVGNFGKVFFCVFFFCN